MKTLVLLLPQPIFRRPKYLRKNENYYIELRYMEFLGQKTFLLEHKASAFMVVLHRRKMREGAAESEERGGRANIYRISSTRHL